MAGHNPGSPTDFQYFYEDEVYKINKRGACVFGLVLENYEANSSEAESDFDTPVQRGEIRVVWHPSGVERVLSEKSVGLADRSLMPGDVVRRLIAGKDTQRGYCRDIVMTAALQIVGTKHVIPCVASERLQPLEEFTPDLAVCLDSWVGTSKAVHSKLQLVSTDGSRLEYPDLDSCPLEDYTMRRRRSTSYSSVEYYPGQVVYGVLGSLDHANWTHTTKEMKAARKHKMHEHKFTVEAVVTESISVHWQCRALSSADSGVPQQPRYLVEGEDLKRLKLLNVFEPCTLQVGDRNFLTITEEDTFTTKKHWRKSQSKYYRQLRKQTRPHKTHPKDSQEKHSQEKAHQVPSKPKKRASCLSRDSSKSRMVHKPQEEMEVDAEIKEVECESVRLDALPSIRIDRSEDAASTTLGNSNLDDTNAEKDDSGISPEPTKEESLMNGDLKSGDAQHAAANDEDSENWENTSSDEGSDTDSGATWSSRCSSAASTRGKRSPQLAVRLLRGKRLKRAVRRAPPAPPPPPGARVVVETLHTTSKANVVWQDGTIELGIPSTQLYPIHHLDGQECFPGDFVVSGAAAGGDDTNSQATHRDYGVVQKVDHHGRTANVKWYRTYTSADEPVPQLMSESEVSVYDLKDHPDFQYRPGTVVIRVANFMGTDVNCTAGQVIDNFPSGRVKVWWVDGHTSMCWPQDLYKVGEYDSEEGELWGSEGSGSEDSWETQSSAHDPEVPHTPDADLPPRGEPPPTVVAQSAESRGPGGVPRLLEPRVAAHMERGRVAMQRLEEMFAKDPKLQSQEIMRKLLNLYKDCRFLDRLMGTTFFHEEHFLGLLERVRERGASTPSAGERRVHEQLTRLFTPTDDSAVGPDRPPDFVKALADLKNDLEIEKQALKKGPYDATVNVNLMRVEPMQIEMGENSHMTLKELLATPPRYMTEPPPEKPGDLTTSSSEFVVKENIAAESTTSANAAAPESATSRNVCYKLCSLINSQLMKAHAEISRRQPTELAQFLNELMSKQTASEEMLHYHFSVQYGYLVVSMSEAGGEGAAEERSGADGRSDSATLPLSEDSAISKDNGSPDSKGTVEGAPLATAESVDAETPSTASPPPLSEEGEGFSLAESAPATHHFRLSMLQPSEPRAFYSAVKREIRLMRSDLPSGVWVRGFEDRIDLLSLMIAGPKSTPYEDGLFTFDVQLGGEYPRAPPLCHYVSYCSDRLNPNLYEDGKVCVSLLGTWSGRGVEVWGKDSSLLQVIVSLQGLILNSEPYFNEAGYEKQKGSQQGEENSRMYNEMVLLKLVQSMTKLVQNPPEIFRAEILRHFRANASALCHRLEAWVAMSGSSSVAAPASCPAAAPAPDFPLIPASRGFCLTLRSSLEAFRNALRRNDIPVEPPVL